MSELPGSIGRYKVVGRIGQGGMGVLFLAFDPMLERQVAIKLLRDDNDELRARFAREARAVARLRHPHIVTIFDVGEQDGNPFIAMEYLHGQTLADVIRGALPIDVPRKLQMIDELCDGLGYAHKAGIVHRDVKPANVMVEQDGAVKVLDFGIARIAESGMTQAGMLIGTLNYMSPEQVAGQMVDGRSDMFAVGALLYELLAYRQAFPGGLHTGILNKILHTQPTPLAEICPGLDAEVIAVVDRALQKDADKRYPDLQAMRKDLQRIKHRLEQDLPGTVVIRREELGETMEMPSRNTPSRRAPQTPRAFSGRDELAKRRAAQTAEHLEHARRAMDAGDFDAVVAGAEQALLLNAEEPEALRLLDRVRQALDDRQLKEALARGAELLDQGQATEALVFVEQALTLSPDAEGALALRRSIDQFRAERDQARQRQEAAQAATARARDLLDREAFDEALRAAEEALSLLPELPDAAALRTRALEALAQRRQLEQERQVTSALATAAALFTKGQREQAVATLETCPVQDDRIREALRDMRARMAEVAARLAREREERERRDQAIADAIGRARAETSHDKALAILHAAQALDPARTDVGRLVESRQEALAQEREEARQAGERREKIAVALRQADGAETHEQAVAILRDAVALDASHAGARSALEKRLDALTREQEEARRARERERRVAAALAESDKTAAHETAIATLKQALSLDPTNTQLRARLETRQAALSEEREQARRESERRAAIAEAIKRAKREKSHAAAIPLLNEALALDASNREVRSLLQSRERALETERAEAARARQVETARESIADLIERRAFDAAEAALRQADALEAPKAFKELRRQLRDAPRTVVAAASAAGDAPAAAPGGRPIVPRPATIISVAVAILVVVAAGYLAMHKTIPSPAATVQPQTDAHTSSAPAKPAPAGREGPKAAPTGSAPTPAPAPAPASEVATPSGDSAAALKVKSTGTMRLAQQLVAQNDLRQAWAVAAAGLSSDPSNAELVRLASDIVSRARQQTATSRSAAAGHGELATGSTVYKTAQTRENEGLRQQRARRNDEAMRAFLAAADLFRQADRDAQAGAMHPEPPARPAPDTGASAGGRPSPPSQPVTPAVETPLPPVSSPATTPGAPAATAKPAPPPPAPPPAPSDEDAIRATLRAYASAHGRLDAGAVARVYPAVNVDALRRSFADSKSFQVEIDQEEITLGGAEATVTCRVRTTFVPKAGSGRSDVRATRFKLRKAANQWVIVSRE